MYHLIEKTIAIKQGVMKMAKVRQDAWSHEDDLLLAETVLRHIREGSTQLRAFDEVGDKLNRTSAACGFRWNAEVRANYEQAIELAKKQRKERKRALANQGKVIANESPKPSLWQTALQQTMVEDNYDREVFAMLENSDQREITLDDVIHYLQQIQHNEHSSQQSYAEIAKLSQDNQLLTEQLDREQKKVKELESELHNMKEDYQMFMKIVDRARKMVVFDEEESRRLPKFRMDKNGNLEQVAK